MDPAVQQQLAEYLKAILATAKSGAAFVQEQAPLVVQEKIAYARALYTIEAIAAVIGCVVLSRYAVKFYRIASAAGGGSCDIWPERQGGLLNVVCVVGAIACGLIAISATETATQVWVAPRLYILEWATQLSHQCRMTMPWQGRTGRLSAKFSPYDRTRADL